MKKKTTIYAAAAALMLTCTACGKQADAPTTEPPTVNEIPAGTETTEQDASPETETPAAPDQGTTPEETIGEQNQPAEDGGAFAQNPENTVQTDNITIEFQTEETKETAEDGTELYIGTFSWPVVTIEGNETAAEKINADLQSRVASSRADTTVLNYAKEDYDFRLNDKENEFPFLTYTEDLGFSVARSDSNVISFVEGYYSFSGGAHGNGTTMGINYNTQTGELISFTELSGDPDKFHADTFAYNQMLAETDEYQERMFDMESGLAADMESVLYAEDKWYLSTSGLTFISDPYALGPYVSGTIEFVIPYSELEKMRLKEEYGLSGRS